MHSPSLAEAYCDRMYEAAMKEGGQGSRALWSPAGDSASYDMYLALIQVPCLSALSRCVKFTAQLSTTLPAPTK